MRFAHPQVLWLLLLVAGLGYLHFSGRLRPYATLRFSSLSVARRANVSRRLPLRHLPAVLRLVVLALLVMGLARPQSGRREMEITSEGIDIILALDISGSMKAEDFKPQNRLHVAKGVAEDFVRGRRGDRIGLVVFASTSFTQCPLTLDYDVVLSQLNHVDFGAIDDGTAIGTAIANGVNRLRRSDTMSKVMILLTDGRNNAGKIDPLTAAALAEAESVKVYTIGVGTEKDAPFPVDDPVFGRRYVRIPASVDDKTLREIADKTGGEYFRATTPEMLETVFEKIDELEKTEIQTTEYVDYEELQARFALPAVLLLVFEVLLSRLWLRRLP
ncbi:MAG: VWA domain-containing protein [Candidatus Eisenbacteria sp.]|nr:VWA domain-containing protein [Candidatus Eisenbacteria bacterium]